MAWRCVAASESETARADVADAAAAAEAAFGDGGAAEERGGIGGGGVDGSAWKPTGMGGIGGLLCDGGDGGEPNDCGGRALVGEAERGSGGAPEGDAGRPGGCERCAGSGGGIEGAARELGGDDALTERTPALMGVYKRAGSDGGGNGGGTLNGVAARAALALGRGGAFEADTLCGPYETCAGGGGAGEAPKPTNGPAARLTA